MSSGRAAAATERRSTATFSDKGDMKKNKQEQRQSKGKHEAEIKSQQEANMKGDKHEAAAEQRQTENADSPSLP